VNYEGLKYTLRNLDSKKLNDFQYRNLRPFEYDPSTADCRHATNIDQKRVNIDEITNHAGKPKIQVPNINQEMVDIDKITTRTGNPKRRVHMIFLTRCTDGDKT